MEAQTNNLVQQEQEPTWEVPAAVLENLATRMRAAGACLMALRPDGTVLFHDPGAEPFFLRYVLPQVHAGEPLRGWLAEGARSLTPIAAPPGLLPGVALAAFPHVERRKLAGVVLLAARERDFAQTEEVLRACSRYGLDAQWLASQAAQLPGMDADAAVRHARLLAGMLRDQVRLLGLERELDSLSGELANTYEELSLIYQISGGMKVNRRAADFFKQACWDVLEVMNVRGVGVALRTENGHHLEPALYGHLNLPSAKVHRLTDELVTLLCERKSALIINDLRTDIRFHWLAGHARQLIAVPLQRQDQVMGCLYGLDKIAGEFDSVDSKLLNSIANESAIYLENALLFEDVHGLMMGLLHALTSAVDAKDAYTCGHSERVALLSRTLAQQIRLPEAQVERIYMAGLLHDVGKIGVPESVLQKTGRLTPEEFEQMKKHPQVGARILRDIKQVEDIIPGVLHHHERYDGKGYPSGLAGENIPLMGRLICLADCFDAMTSNRTYRQAMPLDKALEEIRRCAGTQFDPQLTEAFLQIGAPRFEELIRSHLQQSKQMVDLQQSLRSA